MEASSRIQYSSFPPPYKPSLWQRFTLKKGDIWERRIWEWGVWDKDILGRWVWDGKHWIEDPFEGDDYEDSVR